jgi:hypothetical protein
MECALSPRMVYGPDDVGHVHTEESRAALPACRAAAEAVCAERGVAASFEQAARPASWCKGHPYRPTLLCRPDARTDFLDCSDLGAGGRRAKELPTARGPEASPPSWLQHRHFEQPYARAPTAESGQKYGMPSRVHSALASSSDSSLTATPSSISARACGGSIAAV